MKFLFVTGFDFGTSYSKAVVRDQFTGVARAVRFGSGQRGLLPSFTRVFEGKIGGPFSPDEGLLVSFPKLLAADAGSRLSQFSDLYLDRLPKIQRLLGADTLQEISLLILTRYFLSALQGVSRFIASDEEWKSFDHNTDPVVTQLAVPTGLMGKRDSGVDALMRKALKSATVLLRNATQGGDVSSVSDLRDVTKAVDSLDPRAKEALDTRCITYPEVAAGVQTVFRSRNTPDGKYITLDVGAGTVDLNAFYRRSNSGKESSDVQPGLDYWSCEVSPLGFARLDLVERVRPKSAHEIVLNPLPPVALLSQLEQVIARLMENAFRYQPNRVIGDGGTPWSHRTHIYIWGGGSAFSGYQETLVAKLNQKGVAVQSVNQLPSPSDRFVLPQDVGNFGRLAIAYGLSYHQANLERVRLPNQLKTFDELYPAYWQDTLPKDALCSCQGANPTCSRCHGSGFRKHAEDVAPRFEARPQTSRFQPEVTPVRASRYELALKKCIRDYWRRDQSRQLLLAERYILLNHIYQLTRRSEVQNNATLLSEAANILLFNVQQFGGKVRIKKLSARTTAHGCQLLVLVNRHEMADLEIEHSAPHELERRVNSAPPPPDYIDVGCGIKRTDRGDFLIFASNLNLHTARRRR